MSRNNDDTTQFAATWPDDLMSTQTRFVRRRILMHEVLRNWEDHLCCPADGTTLVAEISDSTGHVDANSGFRCPTCRRFLPMIDGILRCIDLESLEGVDNDPKRREIRARNEAAAQYESNHTARIDSLEILPCLAAMNPTSSDRVVELGCGTGRLTVRYLPMVDCAVALDFSIQSLQVLKEKLSAAERQKTLLMHADISSPPLRKRSFTKCVSFQVLEHLPTPLLRQQALTIAAGLLIPGGTFTCTVYNWSRRKQREFTLGIGDNTAKEGFHDSGIYYYNFEAAEFRRLLEGSGFNIDFIRGSKLALRGEKHLGSLLRPMSRLLARTAWGIRRSDLILATGRTPQ